VYLRPGGVLCADGRRIKTAFSALRLRVCVCTRSRPDAGLPKNPGGTLCSGPRARSRSPRYPLQPSASPAVVLITPYREAYAGCAALTARALVVHGETAATRVLFVRRSPPNRRLAARASNCPRRIRSPSKNRRTRGAIRVHAPTATVRKSARFPRSFVVRYPPR